MRYAISILSLVLATTAFGDDWPQWRGVLRDGTSSETNWSTQWPVGGPKQLWRADVGTGCSAVSVSGGRVFAMGNTNETDTVTCLDAATGKVLWTYSYPCPLEAKMFEGGPGASPTVDKNRVYTLSRPGQFNCLDVATGKVIWAKHLHNDFGGKLPMWGYAGSPLISGPGVVCEVGATNASVAAFDKLTGQIRWKEGNDALGYGSLVDFCIGRFCLAEFNAFGLIIRDAPTGKEIARHVWTTKYNGNITTPIVEQKSGHTPTKIFISSGYEKGCALVEFTGAELKEVWSNTAMRNHMNSSVLDRGHLYGFDESMLTCLDFATGATKWKQDGLGKGALIIAGDKLIIQSETGDLVVAAASPESYKELARAKVLTGRCWVMPVLANGRLYARNNTGNLVCLDVSNSK